MYVLSRNITLPFHNCNNVEFDATFCLYEILVPIQYRSDLLIMFGCFETLTTTVSPLRTYIRQTFRYALCMFCKLRMLKVSIKPMLIRYNTIKYQSSPNWSFNTFHLRKDNLVIFSRIIRPSLSSRSELNYFVDTNLNIVFKRNNFFLCS